jgi:transposase-like protein
MTCHNCRIEAKRFGKRNGLQRYRCAQCGKTYTEPHERPLDAMTTPIDKALLAMRLLVEGNSIRSIERITELHRDTILKLLVLIGEKCEKLMGRMIVNVPVTDVQCDEIWAYVRVKEGHKTPEQANDDSIGDAYCFVAIERDTKLVLNFALGSRSQATTDVFIEGLRHATSGQQFQISTDGFKPYISAITDTLGDRCDFAQLIKVYTNADVEGQRRYSPPDVTHTERVPVMAITIPISSVPYQPCRKTEPHDPNAHAPADPVDECVLKKMGEPVGRVLPALRVVQLRARSPDLARDARDGSGDHDAGVGSGGPASCLSYDEGMKVFWWQGGLHAEPETPEEGRALRLLYDAACRTSIAAEGAGSEPKSPHGGASLTSRIPQQPLEHVIADK